MKNTILAVAGILIIGYSAYRLLTYSSPPVSLPEVFERVGVCTACGEDSPISIRHGDPPPYKCESCGEQKVQMWYFCRDCNRRFVPELTGDPPRPVPFPKCMGCGCQVVAPFEPEDPDHSPVGDVPLKGKGKQGKKKP